MKWGILATGTIAAKFAKTIQAMSAEGEFLSAVASRDLSKAQAFAEIHQAAKAYGSYEDLAADPEIEAVYIATPNNLHAENARMLLMAGKPVLCEKPFTTNAEEADTLPPQYGHITASVASVLLYSTTTSLASPSSFSKISISLH